MVDATDIKLIDALIIGRNPVPEITREATFNVALRLSSSALCVLSGIPTHLLEGSEMALVDPFLGTGAQVMNDLQ